MLNTKMDYLCTNVVDITRRAPPPARPMGRNSNQRAEFVYSYGEASNPAKHVYLDAQQQEDFYTRLERGGIWSTTRGSVSALVTKKRYLNFTGEAMTVVDPAGIKQVIWPVKDRDNGAMSFPVRSAQQLIGCFVIITEHTYGIEEAEDFISVNSWEVSEAAKRLSEALKDDNRLGVVRLKNASVGHNYNAGRIGDYGEPRTRTLMNIESLDPGPVGWQMDRVYYNKDKTVSIWLKPDNAVEDNRPSFFEASVSGNRLKEKAQHANGMVFLITSSKPSDDGKAYYLGAMGDQLPPQAIPVQYDNGLPQGLHVKNMQTGDWVYLGANPTAIKGIPIFDSEFAASNYKSIAEFEEVRTRQISNEERELEMRLKEREAMEKQRIKDEEYEARRARDRHDEEVKRKRERRDGIVNMLIKFISPVLAVAGTLAGVWIKSKYFDSVTPGAAGAGAKAAFS